MEKILSYLNELSLNNNREWFSAHKSERQAANAEFEDLLQGLIFKIGQADPSILHNNPKELTFKQVRDTRFGADKSPIIRACAHTSLRKASCRSPWDIIS